MKTWFAGLLLSGIAGASIIQFTGEPSSTITVEGLTVPIYRSALVDVPQNEIHQCFEEAPVYLSGHGVYAKPLGFISVNVYHALHFMDRESGFSDKENPLPEVGEAQTLAIQFTYLRDLSASQIHDAFEDMLLINDIDTEDPAVAKSLADLTFNVEKGDKSSLVGIVSNRRLESLYLEVHGKVSSNTAEGLAYKFWHAWFGVPIDNGMKRLKALLVGKRF